MRISCGECRTDFRVDPTKIPSGGIRARCSVCGAVIGLGLPDWGGLWEPPMSGRGATDWDLDHHVALESDAEAAPESYEGSTVGLTRVPSGGVPATAASTLTPRLASAARPPAAGASPPPAADEDDWGFPDQWATEVPRRAAARAGEQATAIRGPSVPPARPALRPTAAVSTIATVRRPATVMAPGRPAVPLAISSPGAMPTAHGHHRRWCSS